LTVPNANTNAILITSDHVTVNLNGFTILGPTDCSGGLNPCVNEGIGSGITTGGDYFGSLGTPHFNITIRNGTIQGMGQDGIFLYGDSHLVEYLHVRSNGQSGISIPQSIDKGSSIVQNNTAERNSVDGIQVDRGIVSHNVADVNFSGIDMQNGTASYNVVTRNAAVGLNIRSASYIGNTMDGNQFSVVGGVNMGQNLCNNVVCAGAHY
jgi:hypothetical protein